MQAGEKPASELFLHISDAGHSVYISPRNKVSFVLLVHSKMKSLNSWRYDKSVEVLSSSTVAFEKFKLSTKSKH